MPLKVIYIGHATTLVQWDGLNILTDPVFSRRVLCFPRLEPMRYDPAQLPPLSAVLISHAHYDHLDLFSFKYIPGEVPVLVPEGTAGAIAPFINNPVIELATWGRYSLARREAALAKVGGSVCHTPQTLRVCFAAWQSQALTPPPPDNPPPLSPELQICAVPAKHPGGRFLIPYRYAKCHGYVLSKGADSIYFAGDTGYNGIFKELGEVFKIRLSMLPFARLNHEWFQHNRHMSFSEALKAWEDLGQPNLLPIHCGTFFRGSSYRDRIVRLLRDRAIQNTALQSKLHILSSGESATIATS